MRRILLLIALLSAFATTRAQADVAILVHGYLGDAYGWEASGINAELAARGWQRAGIILPGYQGPVLPPAAAGAPNKVYSIELPSTAPLGVQSDLLTQALRAVEARHPGESVTLIGHSAGGVVARMSVVRGGVGQVRRLITIAAPNLGTERALQALDVTHAGGPLNIVKDIFGGRTYRAVKRSWPVLLDLAPAQPGSTLHWLNVQVHPDIEYVSIVRGESYGLGDVLVPGFSQDLNNVPRLRGKSRTYVVGTEHALSLQDGRLLTGLLR